MEIQQTVVLAVLAGVYFLFATRWLHRALAALGGALVLAAYVGLGPVLGHLVPEMLLVTGGLMVLAGFIKRSGLASWLSLAAAKASRGRPGPILGWAGLLTFLLGALLGPVAAVVLVVPVALLLALELDLPSLPFVVVLSWTSLLGGATVLTAQPGNLWVASALGVTPAGWVLRMGLLTVPALAATLAAGTLVFRKSLRVTHERRARVLEYDIGLSLEDRPLLVKTLTVLFLVLGGWVTGPWTGLDPAVVAAAGAALLLLLDGPRNVDRSLSEIDWGTLAFFGALSAVVGLAGTSDLVKSWAGPTAPDPLTVLWVSALLGTIIDHGAVAGGVVPVLQAWSGNPGLWTFAVLGSSLGAGLTSWGAASNAAALGLAGQGPRAPTWRQFFGYGLIFAGVNLAVVTGLALVLFR